jgi:hypothetical protein
MAVSSEVRKLLTFRLVILSLLFMSGGLFSAYTDIGLGGHKTANKVACDELQAAVSCFKISAFYIFCFSTGEKAGYFQLIDLQFRFHK